MNIIQTDKSLIKNHFNFLNHDFNDLSEINKIENSLSIKRKSYLHTSPFEYYLSSLAYIIFPDDPSDLDPLIKTNFSYCLALVKATPEQKIKALAETIRKIKRIEEIDSVKIF